MFGLRGQSLRAKMTRDQKLEQWAQREIKRNINSIILDDGTGGIVVFGRYCIEPQGTGFTVNTWDKQIHCFSSKKTAMSWCTADHQNHYRLANSLLVLDRKKQALAADIYCRKTIADRGRHEDFYEIINMKIQPKIDLYQAVNQELEKCVNQAKYLQIRGFNNETARTIGSQAK
jgi:hypothetical protein